MKKQILTALAALTLGFNVMAATNGQTLDAEDRAATALINAVTRTSGTYEQAQASMAPALAQKVTPESFAALRKGVGDNFGSLTNVTFRALEKFPDGERLVYLADGQNNKKAMLIVIFQKDGRQQVTDFAITELKPQQKK